VLVESFFESKFVLLRPDFNCVVFSACEELAIVHLNVGDGAIVGAEDERLHA
jgi:hypothetical protein